MKGLRERISRELREVREMYPCATECELVQRLIEMGAHPQVVEIQKKRAKQAGQAEAFQPQPMVCPQQIHNEQQPLHHRGNVIINEDVLGFKVTLHPEPKKQSEYFVKFTPIPGINRTQSERGPTTQVVAGPSAPSEPRDQVHICAMPVTTTSSMSFGEQVLEAILHIMAEAENMQPARSERTSRNRRRVNSRRVRNSGSHRRTGRGRRPQGRRQRRRDSNSDSDASMYEVVDVDYEKISDLQSPPEMDWRLIPRYEMSKREAARQERELYFLMTSESKSEGVERPKVGSPSCCICHENAATRVVIPCGHRCLCQPCAFYIATNRSLLGGTKLPKRCPMCQAAIGLMVRLR